MDLEYYWDNYKNIIITVIVIIITVIISLFFLNYTKNNISIDKVGENNTEIKINKEKNEIKLINNIDKEDKKIENKNIENKNIKYNYQVKIYLKDFDLTCNGDNKICNKILKNKNKLNNYLLGQYSGELKALKEFNLNIDKFFKEKFDKKLFKKELIDLLYTFQKNLVKETNITNTGYEKYFKFKLKNGEKTIKLNNLEIQCASEIKNSIIPGSFEEDKIITKRVEENCNNLGGNNLLTVENNNYNEQKQNFQISINIKSLNIKYDFYKKEGKNYEKIESKKIDLDYEKKL